MSEIRSMGEVTTPFNAKTGFNVAGENRGKKAKSRRKSKARSRKSCK